MNTLIELTTGRSGASGDDDVHFCLQRRSTSEFWNGKSWQADIASAAIFHAIDQALECAHSLPERTINFIAVFVRTNFQIVIPLA